MSPEEFKQIVRKMRYWQQYDENDPSSISKNHKKELEEIVDIYLKYN